MKSGKSVKLLTVVITLLLLIPMVGARGVEKPVPHDEFLYTYFSHTLEKFTYSLKYAYEGNDYGLTLANSTRDELLEILRESKPYQERGIKVKVLEVLPPFYNFSVELVTLDKLVLQYYSTNESPAIAVGIVGTVERMREYLNEIDSIELYNDTKILKFDTSDVEKYLDKIYGMAERKIEKEEKKEKQTPLTLYVTNPSPIINQTVTFFGTAPENGSVTILINGTNWSTAVNVSASSHFFTLPYRFEKPGRYFAKAVQGNLSTETIKINVRKIPASFVVVSEISAVVNTTLTFRAVLIDYYSRPLPRRNITVNGSPFVTGPDGSFSLNITSPREASFPLTLYFEGDELHAGTSLTIRISFTRIPTGLSITAPGTTLINEALKIEGSISPPINATIQIYVNGNLTLTVNSTKGAFNLTLTPKKAGTLQVYALFNGTDLYLPSRSNTVFISVIPMESNTWRYLTVILILLGLVLYTQRRRFAVGGKWRRRNNGGPDEFGPPSQEAHPKESPEIEVPENVGEAYGMVRKALSEKMGIPGHLTPREALERLKDWDGYEHLKTVTLVHEKAVYGKMEPTDEELRVFKEAVKAIIALTGGEA